MLEVVGAAAVAHFWLAAQVQAVMLMRGILEVMPLRQGAVEAVVRVVEQLLGMPGAQVVPVLTDVFTSCGTHKAAKWD
jgi:hypothetical protein